MTMLNYITHLPILVEYSYQSKHDRGGLSVLICEVASRELSIIDWLQVNEVQYSTVKLSSTTSILQTALY